MIPITLRNIRKDRDKLDAIIPATDTADNRFCVSSMGGVGRRERIHQSQEATALLVAAKKFESTSEGMAGFLPPTPPPAMPEQKQRPAPPPCSSE